MAADHWPALPYAAWRDTYATLHMWFQVVGKLTIPTTPLVNHHWSHTFLFVGRGLRTQPMTWRGKTLSVLFDFVSHEVVFSASDGGLEKIELEPRSVAQFHGLVRKTIDRMGFEIPIKPLPVEVPNPIRFNEDHSHRSYDPAQARAFWRALDSMRPVFEEFRARFVGKCSPVHFFWGSFDLACTRFSGRRAPPRNDGAMMREAYSHECISHGWWPGNADQDAAFYAYAAPEPAGFAAARVQPVSASYSAGFKEFLLPYEAIRTSASPEKDLMLFLETSYEAGARLAKWNRTELER